MKRVAERIGFLEELRKATFLELKKGLVKALNDKSPTVRGFAIEIIGDQELHEMLADVVSMLDDSSDEVRMLAIESIAKLDDGKRYVKQIAKYLQDKNELVRVAAAEFLGEFGKPNVLDDLEMALNDESALVRSYVTASIGSIGQKKSVSVPEKFLLSERDEVARVGFYVGLHKLKQKEYLHQLMELIESEDYRVRCAAANSLSSLKLASTEISLVVKILKSALGKEKTVAARSSIESTLNYLQH